MRIIMNNQKYTDQLLQLSALLHALSHPARLQVVEHLARYHECPAGTISEKLPLCKSTVSQHLALLRNAGLISCNPRGTCQEYRLNVEKLVELGKIFDLYLKAILLVSSKATKNTFTYDH